MCLIKRVTLKPPNFLNLTSPLPQGHHMTIVKQIAGRIAREWQFILLVISLISMYYAVKTIPWPEAKSQQWKIARDGLPPWEKEEKDKWVYNPQQVFPPEWYQVPKVTDPQCKAKDNVFFLRTHQTGTSSVSNIFYRFGQEKELSFVMMPMKTSLNYPGRIKLAYLEEHKPEGGYNILCQYMRYRRMDVLRIMNEGSIFTTILRHPVDQFLSVFHQHDLKGLVRNLLPHHNPYQEFFRDPKKFTMMAPDALFHLIQNGMSFDLGLEPPKFVNEGEIDQFIKNIDQDFHLVMILELLDESLVLLRRLMCWDLKHVIYVKLSYNNNFSQSIDEDIRKKIMDWNSVDVKLYNHFLEKMKRIIAEQDEAFHREVELLKEINAEFWQDCYSNVLPVYAGNKVGYELAKTHKTNLTCKILATDDVTQNHVVSLKQYKDVLKPHDILMVRNHMQNMRKFNQAVLEWDDVKKVLRPEKATKSTDEL